MLKERRSGNAKARQPGSDHRRCVRTRVSLFRCQPRSRVPSSCRPYTSVTMTDPMPVDHVQTKREIEQLLADRGLHPRKRFGQHFLIDGNLMRRLADCAELDADDTVLEVGAGTGGLTDLLAARAGKVICVEIDRDLLDILSERFAENERVVLIEGDILTGKHALHPDVTAQIGGTRPLAIAVKLVANLPYQVATPLIMNLIVDYPQVRRLCFTVQLEVGERITAAPGGKSFGPLAIISQAVCDIRTVARISPQSFWPRPAVDSVMLRLDVTREPFADRDELSSFAAFVRGVFEHRRKRLRAAAGYGLDRDLIERLGASFDLNRRPEQVPVSEWIQMFQTVGRSEPRPKGRGAEPVDAPR